MKKKTKQTLRKLRKTIKELDRVANHPVSHGCRGILHSKMLGLNIAID